MYPVRAAGTQLGAEGELLRQILKSVEVNVGLGKLDPLKGLEVHAEEILDCHEEELMVMLGRSQKV